jgi:diaminohydroxyphosphoribosylaminopyrimidine deaminase / 5-amino-6-(5-phosphoribosylamino)uracil reductase
MTDADFMRRALVLAERGRNSTSPNPMVGCVVVRNGRPIGEGFHRRAGEPHAELEALRNSSEPPAGATVYVNLEPCCHQGRTPPCTRALVEAGVARVVAAVSDPNPEVSGRGFEELKSAGIGVEVGLLADEAARLNEKFLWAIRESKPFLLLKVGMTFDGKLATETGHSRWITSEPARTRSLELREEYDAILVGSGTVASDDPQLTRRLGLNGSIQPWLRIVVDATGDLPLAARLLTDGNPTLVATAHPERHAPRDNVEIVGLPATGGELNLDEVLRLAYQRGARSIIAEGGARLHSTLIRRGLWQKMTAFVAPALVGGAAAPAILSGSGVARLEDAFRFRFDRAALVGPDLMVVGYPLERVSC